MGDKEKIGDKDDLEKITETVSEQEQECAQAALNEFKKNNYLGALQFINKLDYRTGDFKVIHNKALVEYFKSDLRRTENFQKSLTSICTQFRMKIENLDDVDQCILYYNQAILYYHLRKYTAAIEVMDRVYKFVEPMEDALVKQISLFVIELQLCVRQPDKALSLISYVENQILNGTPNIKLLDKNIKEKKVQSPPDEEFRKKLTKYKARCYIMNHNLSSASKEIKILAKEKSSNINSLFMAANVEYLKGNINEVLKILDTIPKDSLLYNECGESSSIMLDNNMGVVQLALGKPNLACHFFQTALRQDIPYSDNVKKNMSEKPLHTLGGSKYHELVYNLGVALLYAKRPAQAFESLVIAVRRYHRNSRLWMRLAECCIMVNKESNEYDFDFQERQKDIITGTIGSRDKRKIILNTNVSKDNRYSSESMAYAIPTPSLEFASLCLRNAFLLLPSDTAASPMPLFLMPGGAPPGPSSSTGPSPSSPLSPESIANLRNSILASSAYVSLCLGDYILALEHAQSLLKQPRISEAHKLLGHLYCAEAFVLLDKTAEALEHLNPEIIRDVSLELSPTENDENVKLKTATPTKWFPSNLASAQAAIQYNIAVVKTIKGQLADAIKVLKQLWQASSACKVPGQVTMLVLYVELRLGHQDSAKNLIQQCLSQKIATN